MIFSRLSSSFLGLVLKASLAILGFYSMSCLPGAAQTITPYLESPRPDSIWITWQTTSGTDSTVTYGLSASALNLTATAPASATQLLATNYDWHEVRLSGLTANTYYYYKVTTGSNNSAVFRFRSQPPLGAAPPDGHFRVLVAGDNQIQSPTRWKSLLTAARTKIESLYNEPLESAVNLLIDDGDQVDSGTISEYQKTHFAMVNEVASNIPVTTAIGNHEGYSDTSYTLYKAHFNYSDLNYGVASPNNPLYYAYQVADAVFIVMDTEDNSTTQANWVSQVVNIANNDSTVDFIVAVQHRPYNVELYVGDTSPWIHNTIMPILASSPKSVLDFSGHHHMYCRGQTHNYPIYQMISGGSAWDEYWGQSTEQDMDDIQKTICNWTWALIDFDVANKKMTVDSYSEGGPLIGPNGSADSSVNTVGYYTSLHIDNYHRQPALAGPNQPSLTVSNPGTIALPYTFHSSAFSTSTSETLNTTEFQISSSSTFASTVTDVTRDFEDYYLDTGSPNYTPVNQNANVNISDYTVPTNGVPNGSYYIRIRHRDSNVVWSPWSSAVPFTISGSVAGTTSLSLDKAVYNAGNTINAAYKFGTGLATDWVGVYPKGITPNGNPTSTVWSYVNATAPNTLSSGTISLSTSKLTAGSEYFAAFFTNNVYTEIAPIVPFYFGPTPTISVSQAAYNVGDTVSISYSGALAASKDWIGIYHVGDTPGSTGSRVWSYVKSGVSSYTLTFTGLPAGYYYAYYFVNDDYTAISNRVAFTVNPATGNIATATVSNSSQAYGSSFNVTFGDGPGNLKDYIGIFNAQGTPGGSGPYDKLQAYEYFQGAANGTVAFSTPLPAGNYKAALYINDSYTAASNQTYFSITDPRPFVLQTLWADAKTLQLSWPGETTVNYMVESSADLINWTSVQTVTALNANTQQISVSSDPAVTPQNFFRVTNIGN